MESNTEVFRATWNNMPTWCRYCHKDGHTKFECAASKARVLCYSCHELGHRSFECPCRNSTIIAHKKQDRKSYQKHTPKPDESNSPTIPSEELNNEDTDEMNIDGFNYSVVEEDDTYAMQKYEFIWDLEESTSAECLTIFTNLCAVNEMETESDEHGNITEWKLLK